jgi:hypothetical protein
VIDLGLGASERFVSFLNMYLQLGPVTLITAIADFPGGVESA